MIRIAVLASGRGSNLQALLDACADKRLDASVVYVASNHRAVAALDRATRAGVESGVFVAKESGGRAAAQAAMADAVAASRPDLVVLAGFDRILEDVVFERLGSVPIINIHPSMLPAYGGVGMLGEKVHAAVLADRALESGCSVFLVERGAVDGGTILVQRTVPVLPSDDVATLAARVLAEEHVALVEAVSRFAMEPERSAS